MKRILIATLIGVSLLTACAVVPVGRRGHGPGVSGAVVVPILPSVVVLGAEPYYTHGGYHYHYRNNNWYYSRSRSGPWVDLPRNHYPREVRFQGRR